jgi:hypothetical protein
MIAYLLTINIHRPYLLVIPIFITINKFTNPENHLFTSTMIWRGETEEYFGMLPCMPLPPATALGRVQDMIKQNYA